MSRTRIAPHHRDLMDYLTGYGATRVRFDPNHGKHPRLQFCWKGEDKQLIVSNSPSDPRNNEIKRGDIRRMLGDSLPKAERPHRTLEAMTLELRTHAPPSPSPATGGVAVYLRDERRCSVRFQLPVTPLLPVGQPVSVRRMGPDDWLIRHDPEALRPCARLEGKFITIDRQCDRTDELLGGLGVPHPRTPAQVVEVDGEVMVHVLLDQTPAHSRTMGQPQPRRRRSSPPVCGNDRGGPDLGQQLAAAGVEAHPEALASHPHVLDRATDEKARITLAQIRELERTTGLRLKKMADTHDWAFTWRID